MSNLFSPLQIKSVLFKNRLGVSPMCMYSGEDGFSNNWHLVHLGSRAVGGAAMVMVEATAVVPEGRITLGDLGLWKDEHIGGLYTITSFIKQRDCIAGIQLAHAGRKASIHKPWEGGKKLDAGLGQWQTVAPSDLAFSSHSQIPTALNEKGIANIVVAFTLAAKRALIAGFEVIEIHAAHGYLLHEFLSPLSNLRKDNYGGSFENRCRFLLEIIDSVKTVWPSNLPLFVRISGTEWTDGGWTIDDSVRLAKLLYEAGVDVIDCSSGGNIPGVEIPLAPGYQLPIASKIKSETAKLTAAVGLIFDAHQAEEIICSGKADLIFMGRELLSDPYFPLHAAKALNADTKLPVQYERFLEIDRFKNKTV